MQWQKLSFVLLLISQAKLFSGAHGRRDPLVFGKVCTIVMLAPRISTKVELTVFSIENPVFIVIIGCKSHCDVQAVLKSKLMVFFEDVLISGRKDFNIFFLD